MLSMRDAKHDADSSIPGVDLKQGSNPGLQHNLFANVGMELEGAPYAKADRKPVNNARGRSNALPEGVGMTKSHPPVLLKHVLVVEFCVKLPMPGVQNSSHCPCTEPAPNEMKVFEWI